MVTPRSCCTYVVCYMQTIDFYKNYDVRTVTTAQTEQMFPLADRQSYQKGKKSRGLDWLTGP